MSEQLRQLLKDLSDDEACEVIEQLAKDRGGQVIERVVDKILEEGEWPEVVR